MVFGAITDGSASAIDSLTILGKSLKDIKNDFNSMPDADLGYKLQKGFGGIFNGGLSDSDIRALREYDKLIDSGTASADDLAKALSGAGNKARKLAADAGGAKVNIQALTTSEKAAAVEAELMGFAINAALSFGIGIAISAIVSGISKLIHASEEARQKADEMRQESQGVIDTYKDEAQTISDLYKEYISLYTSTNDLTNAKDKLLTVQDKLNNSFTEAKDKVDLLNGSIKENLELQRKQTYEEAKKTKAQIEAEYEDVVLRGDRFFDATTGIDKVGSIRFDKLTENTDFRNLEKDFVKYFNEQMGQVETEYIDSFTGEVKQQMVDALQEGVTSGLIQHTDFILTGTDTQDVLDDLYKMHDMYKEWDGHNNDTLKAIEDVIAGAEEQVKHNTELKENMAQVNKIISDYEDSLGSEVADKLGSVLEEASQKLADLKSASGYEKYSISQDIENLQSQALLLAGDNAVLAENVNAVFSNYNEGLSSTTSGISNWREAWFEALNDVDKGIMKNVDSMKSALQKMANGELMTWDDYWSLSELDPDHVLSPVQQVGDKVKLTEQQLISLKDQYIQKQIESLKLDQAERQQQLTNATTEIAKYTRDLRELEAHKSINSNSDYQVYINRQTKIKNNIQEQQDEVNRLNEEYNYTNTLIKMYESNLGDTIDRQQQLNSLTNKLNEEAENLVKAYEGAFDIIIKKHEDEKSALEANKEILEEQRDLLQEQADLIQETIDNYESAADAVQEAIKKQIESLKAQNEEREDALDLAEKLANLENAKNKKVRTYTEAGGWQYEAKKSDVDKAQREVDKAQTNQEIKVLEDYLKRWEEVTQKRQKAEDERLAEQILGADWRDKIAEQDLDILNNYETEYDKYADELYRVSNVEMTAVNKSIEAANKEIAAKDKEIKKWQSYKAEVSSAAQTAKNEVSTWYSTALEIAESMGSDDGDIAGYIDNFYTNYKGILEELTDLQNGLNTSINGMEFESVDARVSELEHEVSIMKANWLGIREDIAKATREANHYATSEDEGRRYMASGANGTVVDYTGLMAVHGTKQKAETIFNANDSAKLYEMVHSTPSLIASAYTEGTRLAQSGIRAKSDTANAVTFNGTVINLPNVANAEQFARQMESYMQTVLTESQVFKPRR